SGGPLYVEITHRIATGWNEGGNLGLVGPATEPQVLAKIRGTAPHLPILCPGVGAQGGDLEAAVQAGLDADGAGLLVNVSRAIMEAPDPGEAAREWRDRLEAARAGWKVRRFEGSKVGTFEGELASAIVEMYDIGAIRFEPA